MDLGATHLSDEVVGGVHIVVRGTGRTLSENACEHHKLKRVLFVL